MRIKKGDQVQIVAGKDQGKRGKVLRTVPSKSKVVVEGLNIVKKHKKGRRGQEKGQRVEIPAPIAISNVMLVCPNCGKITRVEFRIENDSKVRFCKKCKNNIQK